MNPKLITFTLGMAMLASALGGCGAGTGQPGDAQVTAAVRASARELEPEIEQEQAVTRFMALVNQLRELPQLAPLFAAYQVGQPVVVEDDERSAGLIELLHAVKITLVAGTVTITNRETGGVIFTAPRSDLASGVFQAENLPGAAAPPAATCTYAYSAWGDCQTDGTQSRTVVSAAPEGCTGTPQLVQPCGVTAPAPATCTSFTYSAWSACQPDGTQTRTVLTSSPAGCTGGTPGPLTQACTYTPPMTACTSFTYSDWGACQPDGTQARTVLTSSPAGCAGGTPGPLTQACTYTPPVIACTSFTYSDWGACQPDGTQARTVLTSSPAGCTGGTPGPLTQSCTYTAPIDGAALYGQYCAGCHGPLATSNLKGIGMTVQMIKDRRMTQGLSDPQLQAIVDVVGP